MTLKEELESHGHDCSVLLLRKPQLAMLGEYDLVIMNNRTGLRFVDQHGIISERYCFFIHSLMDDESLPLGDGLSYDYETFVFGEKAFDYISEYIGGFDPILVRNAIDMEYFKPVEKPLKSNLIQIADLRSGYLYANIIREVASVAGYWVRDLPEPTKDIRQLIRNADIIVAYGRHAIEALAMGKHVIVYGVNGGDGLVTIDNVRHLARTNFSGWTFRTMPPPGQISSLDILKEIEKVPTNDIRGVTEYVRSEYCIYKFINHLKLEK